MINHEANQRQWRGRLSYTTSAFSWGEHKR